MAIDLKKGQKIDLTKSNPDLKKILVELDYQAGSNIEIDPAAFLLGSNGKVRNDSDFVFYNNLEHPSGAVKNSGDKNFEIDLEKIPSDIEKIDFTVTIYDAIERHQNFGQVSNVNIKIMDEFGEELIRFDLEKFSVETAIVVGEIYRRGSEWKFNAIGAGWSGGLHALGVNFGVDIGDQNQTSIVPIQNSVTPIHSEIIESSETPEIIHAPDRIMIYSIFSKNWAYDEFPKLNLFFESRLGIRTNVTEGSGSFSSYPYVLIDSRKESDYKKFFKININGRFIDEISRMLIVVSNIKCDGNCSFSNDDDSIGLSIDVNSNDGAWAIILLENIGGNFMIHNVAECFSNLKSLKDIHNFNF